MKKQFSVTFERYFPHASQGLTPLDDEEVCEADEAGFVIEDVSLRDAMHFGLECSNPSRAGSCEPDVYQARGVRWLTFYDWNDGTQAQIEEGIHETRSLHFPAHITESSRKRICRLFGVWS